MSIYDVLSMDISILAYSILHQPRKTVAVKEYSKSLLALRTDLKVESEKIQTVWQNYLSDLTAKTVQTTRGNLSQFLTTPIQSDTGEIQHIISDQIGQTAEQLLPKIPYGLLDGYDGKFLVETSQIDIPKSRILGARTFFQNIGFKIGRNNSTIFESLYFIKGGVNLDILEYLVRSCLGVYNSSHGTKLNQSVLGVCSLYNLLYVDGTYERDINRFEFQVRFDKGKETYELFHNALSESMRAFRLEIHDLNVSVWQRKLGLGRCEEYLLCIRTKDRSTLRAAISNVQKLASGKNIVANALGTGFWLAKEII